MTNPKPASPLPWKYEHRYGGSKLGDPEWGKVGLWSADSPHFIMGSGAGWDGDFEEPCDHDRAYIVWAANNAPAMAARIERLEAALRFYAERDNHLAADGPDDDIGQSRVYQDRGNIARKALEEA